MKNNKPKNLMVKKFLLGFATPRGLRETFCVCFSQTPTPCLDMFQSKIDNQFKNVCAR